MKVCDLRKIYGLEFAQGFDEKEEIDDVIYELDKISMMQLTEETSEIHTEPI